MTPKHAAVLIRHLANITDEITAAHNNCCDCSDWEHAEEFVKLQKEVSQLNEKIIKEGAKGIPDPKIDVGNESAETTMKKCHLTPKDFRDIPKVKKNEKG